MKLLYFAWLRERLNRSEEIISPPASVTTVAEVIDWMSANDDAFALAFEKRTLIKSALDEKLVDHSAPLGSATTLAFFPPMTGG